MRPSNVFRGAVSPCANSLSTNLLAQKMPPIPALSSRVFRHDRDGRSSMVPSCSGSNTPRSARLALAAPGLSGLLPDIYNSSNYPPGRPKPAYSPLYYPEQQQHPGGYDSSSSSSDDEGAVSSRDSLSSAESKGAGAAAASKPTQARPIDKSNRTANMRQPNPPPPQSHAAAAVNWSQLNTPLQPATKFPSTVSPPSASVLPLHHQTQQKQHGVSNPLHNSRDDVAAEHHHHPSQATTTGLHDVQSFATFSPLRSHSSATSARRATSIRSKGVVRATQATTARILKMMLVTSLDKHDGVVGFLRQVPRPVVAKALHDAFTPLRRHLNRLEFGEAVQKMISICRDSMVDEHHRQQRAQEEEAAKKKEELQMERSTMTNATAAAAATGAAPVSVAHKISPPDVATTNNKRKPIEPQQHRSTRNVSNNNNNNNKGPAVHQATKSSQIAQQQQQDVASARRPSNNNNAEKNKSITAERLPLLAPRRSFELEDRAALHSTPQPPSWVSAPVLLDRHDGDWLFQMFLEQDVTITAEASMPDFGRHSLTSGPLPARAEPEVDSRVVRDTFLTAVLPRDVDIAQRLIKLLFHSTSHSSLETLVSRFEVQLMCDRIRLAFLRDAATITANAKRAREIELWYLRVTKDSQPLVAVAGDIPASIMQDCAEGMQGEDDEIAYLNELLVADEAEQMHRLTSVLQVVTKLPDALNDAPQGRTTIRDLRQHCADMFPQDSFDEIFTVLAVLLDRNFTDPPFQNPVNQVAEERQFKSRLSRAKQFSITMRRYGSIKGHHHNHPHHHHRGEASAAQDDVVDGDVDEEEESVASTADEGRVVKPKSHHAPQPPQPPPPPPRSMSLGSMASGGGFHGSPRHHHPPHHNGNQDPHQGLRSTRSILQQHITASSQNNSNTHHKDHKHGPLSINSVSAAASVAMMVKRLSRSTLQIPQLQLSNIVADSHRKPFFDDAVLRSLPPQQQQQANSSGYPLSLAASIATNVESASNFSPTDQHRRQQFRQSHGQWNSAVQKHKTVLETGGYGEEFPPEHVDTPRYYIQHGMLYMSSARYPQGVLVQQD